MHQHFGIREAGRTVLTITGIALLIIFGVRAASQASSLAAVGGKTRRTVASIPPDVHWLTAMDTQAMTATPIRHRTVVADTPPPTTPVSSQTRTAKIDTSVTKLVNKVQQSKNEALSKGSAKTKRATEQLAELSPTAASDPKHAKEPVR